MPTQPITHILFDADGVIQDIPGGWYAAMEPHVGDRAREFLHKTWKDELPALAGIGDYPPLLAATLREYGVETSVDEVLADVWCRIETDRRSLDLVGSLRAAGYGVHLATNQEQYRAGYMQDALGYAALFDRCFYSCEVGVAKPDPRFFTSIIDVLGADPGTVLFVDDTERNVLSARDVGLRAVHWHLDAGHDALLELMAAHGVDGRRA